MQRHVEVGFEEMLSLAEREQVNNMKQSQAKFQPILLQDQEDELVWHWWRGGTFSIRSFYYHLLSDVRDSLPVHLGYTES